MEGCCPIRRSINKKSPLWVMESFMSLLAGSRLDQGKKHKIIAVETAITFIKNAEVQASLDKKKAPIHRKRLSY